MRGRIHNYSIPCRYCAGKVTRSYFIKSAVCFNCKIRTSKIRTKRNKMKRSLLRKISKSPIAEIKKEIQSLLRELAIIRDKECVMGNYPETGECGGRKKNGELVLQFDHLISRQRSIGWDVRLGITVCLRHHFYYKKQYPFEYERCVIDNIGPERAKLLYRIREDTKPYHMNLSSWTLLEIALQKEVNKLKIKDLQE